MIPRDNEEEAFVAVSMYARWVRPHPSTKSRWGVGCSDASAHRIISDLSTFIGHTNPTTYRILAAGDLNMFYGAIGSRLSLPQRDRTVWDRMQALGLEFLGPQAPHGRRAETTPDDVPPDTKNVPTYYCRSGPATAVNQLDYAFASRGFHEKVSVRAMNEIEEWGPSDHCRLMIEVKDNARVAVPKNPGLPDLSRQPAECASSRIAMPKVREAIKLIEADGCRKVTTKGSHRQFKHPMKTGRVTIAGRLSDDLG